MFLCQEKYATEVLVKFDMEDCNSASTPLKIGVKYYAHVGFVDDDAAIEGVGYKSATGSLLYSCSGASFKVWLQQSIPFSDRAKIQDCTIGRGLSGW